MGVCLPDHDHFLSLTKHCLDLNNFKYFIHNSAELKYLQGKYFTSFLFQHTLELHPSAHLSICMSICLSAFPAFYLSAYMSACLSICIFICISVCLHFHISAYLSACLYARTLKAWIPASSTAMELFADSRKL